MTVSTFYSFATMQEAFRSFDNALVFKQREDKTRYVVLSDEIDSALKEQFQNITQELHLGEFPNDWRYSVIKDLISSFLESLENDYSFENERDFLEDRIYQIVDSCVSISNHSLFQWLADVPSRSSFTDGPYGEDLTLVDMARQRQYEEIETMARLLVDAIDSLSTLSRS